MWLVLVCIDYSTFPIDGENGDGVKREGKYIYSGLEQS